MICPNLKDPVVKKQFDKLTEVLGEPTAYLVWHKNNGNYLDKESNGNDSTLWNKLISKYSEEESIKLKSKVFSSEFKPSVVPLERVKFDYNKPAGEQSRAARDNAKLDLMRSILTNSDTFSKAINPGNFDVLKEFASHDNPDSIAYRKGIKSTGLKIASPRANREIFVRNMTGKAILGIFVNHSVNHAITQHSDLMLAESIDLDGKSLRALNQQKNTEGKFISRLLGMFVGASADNAKEPVASDLNISTFTVDILSTLLRVGYPLDTALYFINQPVIIALSEEYALEGYDAAEYYNVLNKIKAKYISVEPIKTDTITKDMLKNDIGKANGDVAFQQRQVALLEMFDKVKTQSQSLGKLISVMRPDDTKRQIISSTNEVYMTNLSEVMSSEAFNNVESVFEKYPLLHTFYTNAVENSLLELNKWFPWNKPAMLTTKASIKSNIPSYKRLSSDMLEKINMEFLNFMVTNFEFFQHDKKESIIKSYPQQFKNYVAKNKLQDNPLLSRLRVDKVEGTNLNVISLNSSSSMSDVDKAKISDAWSELLEDHKQFAEDLVRYTYHSHGFVINPKTFSHLIPVEFYRSLYDSNGLHFNDYLNSFIGDLDSSISFDNFVDQFFRNNWEDKQVVPQIKSDGKKVPKGVIMSNGVPVKLELTVTDHRNFVHKFYEDSVDFIDYITLNYDSKKYLFKQTTKSGEYIRVEPLGVKNVIKEYDLGQANLISIFTSNTVKPVEQPKIPEASSKLFDNTLNKINIYAGTNENAELSNFAIRPFEYNTKTFPRETVKFQSVEQAFQFMKLGYSPSSIKNESIAEKILGTTDRKTLRNLGKSFDMKKDGSWDRNSSRIMKELLKASFEQNPKALQTLLATGNTELTHTQDNTKWNTEFPKLLMEVRDELRSTKTYEPEIDKTDGDNPFGVQDKEVIPLTSNFTRQSVAQDPNYIYLFTDNAQRTSGGNKITPNWYTAKYGIEGNYPTMTQAVIRGLNNAMPITTMIDDRRTQWTDNKFEQYKAIIDSEIEEIKDSLRLGNFKGIKFAAQMPFGKGKISNMKQSAPKTWSYMNEKLLEIGIDNTGDTPKVIQFGVQSEETDLPFDPDKDSILNLTPEQRAKFEALVKDRDSIGTTVPEFMKGLTKLQREALRYEMQHKEITFKC